MPTYGVTDAGFVRQPYTVTRDEIRGKWRDLIDPDLYTQDGTDLGDVTAIQADAIDQLEAKLEAIGTLLDRDQAVGVHLVGLARILGVSWAAATYSSVQLTLTGTPGLLVVAGSVSVPNADNVNFLSISDVTLDSLGSGIVTARADTTGAVAAVAGTLTATAGLPAGVTAVNNLNDATLGSAADTAENIRIKCRRRLGAAGRGPLDALYAALEDTDQVTSLQDFRVIVNTSGVVDADGRPDGSIEVVTIGGSTAEVAAVLAANTPIGVERVSTALSYSVDVTDSQGNVHAIVAGYAIELSMYCLMGVTVSAAEGWDSSTGPAAVKAAVVAYGAALKIGEDIRDLHLKRAVGAVAGVVGVTSLTLNQLGEPAASGDYAVGTVEVARFATARTTLSITEE